MKVQALFKKAGSAPAKTAGAKKTTKKSPAPAKPTSGKKTSGGWLGNASSSIDLDKWYGPDRKLFLPSGLLDRADVPEYLNGTYAGDYGYDPLGLGKDGAIIPEGLAANGADIKGATWFETGAAMLDGNTLNYFVVPFANIPNPLPLPAIVAIQVALLGGAEYFRRNGTGPAGYSPGVGKFDESVFDGVDPLHPGGPFDPLGLADDPEVFAELKVKEIKNGRLAMVAALGFFIQALVTKEGPYANWSQHVADPFGYNLLTILASDDRAPVL
eukprot:jgi/Picre1/31771/NNA_007121.t1